MKTSWAKNPQFMIENRAGMTEFFISLAQNDGRLRRGIKFPYEEEIHPVCFCVMRLAPGQDRLDTFDKKAVVGISTVIEHREVSLRLKLDKGNYVIVPSTRHPHQAGKFYLSIYFNGNRKNMRFSLIGHPKVLFAYSVCIGTTDAN